MRPHYDNLIQACVHEGIGYRNPLFNAADPELDADGVPVQPEMLYLQGQEYRVFSFDEMRCDDKTHGDGGDRKGRCERTVRCGARDDGECVGGKHAAHPASLVGGTNGAGEGLPCFAVTATGSVDLDWFTDGPTTTINGKRLLMDGTCNAKGSVNNAAALEYVERAVLRAFEARELPTAERKAIMVCDGCGTHLSPDFIDLLVEKHIVLILRTPNTSQKTQPEDLVSFQRVKNAKEFGFYKAKQLECLHQLASKGRAAIPYDRLFGNCLKPAWENAFSPANNREAWRQAGLMERGGITARPYWLQLRAEQPLRKMASAEKRKRAIAELGLTLQGDLQGLKACWEQKGGSGAPALTNESVDEAGDDDEEEGDGEPTMKAGKLTSGELSQLGCAATDPAARKYLQYKGDMAAIKSMKTPELKEHLAPLNIPYTNADEAKVACLRALQRTYESTPSLRSDGENVAINWTISASMLPTKLKVIMFPMESAQTPAPPAPKKRRIGEGAYLSTAQPSGGSLLLKAPPTPVPMLQLTSAGAGAQQPGQPADPEPEASLPPLPPLLDAQGHS